MQDRKRKRFLATKLFAVALTVAFTGSLFASGEKRIGGTVKSIGSDSVTVETADHKLQDIKITSATKFLKHHKSSSLSEMKPGVHAVFRVIPSTSSASTTSTSTPAANVPAADASSTSATTADTNKDSLSLGIGFTAVQVSY